MHVDINQILNRLAGAYEKSVSTPSHFRSKVLQAVAEGLRKDREVFAQLICEEVYKPLKEARREVDRAIFTFQWASEEALRFGGEWFPIDFDPITEERLVMVRRVARGPCLLIAPFNFPLNLVTHKVAPAIAVGAPFLLKPPPQAPKTAQKLKELILASGWPQEFFEVVSCSNEVAESLVRDERFRVLSFTGSAPVGWKLKSLAGKKHVVLELGGNAAVGVAEDADIPWAAARCAWGGFYYSGQVCISVQRIYAQKSVYEEFKKYFLANVEELKIGDPKDEKTDVGPLITEEVAKRVEGWIEEAKTAGAKVLMGGARKGSFIPPTVLEKVPPQCKVMCEEVFGPVAMLDTYAHWEELVQKINASQYGLQSGLFTRNLTQVMEGWKKIRVGGLIVNDIPAFRSDAMPYGGSKESGMGREGVRYAMEEYTEPRSLVIKP
ncbi:MAG: aldehyde dehydrogenase family protein [Elusimicrobia bacterium]|nr:aldehyde dehydrogenase family protein [Elusimicrobiota bacterium]